MMNDETKAEFRAHAEEEFPRECCGLVLVFKGRERYVRCRNIATEQEKQFIMSPEDYAGADEYGEIVAVCHSHPNELPKPSQADKVACEASGLAWHIVHVSIPEGGETPMATDIVTVEPSGYEAPLVGRVFSHGILDCYALVRDYYKREMDIELPDFERRDEWWKRGDTLYEDNFRACGFESITGPIQPGDAILMQIRSPTPNHAAIYIGDGKILHHFYGRLSSRDIYGGYWQETTRYILRKVR